MAFRLPQRSANATIYELLTRLAAQIHSGSDLLAELISTDPGEIGDVTIKTLSQEIRELATASDEIRADTLRLAQKTFVVPVDREDLFTLVQRLSDAMAQIDAAADLVAHLDVGALPRGFSKQAAWLQRCGELTSDGISQLAARGPELAAYAEEITRIEAAANTQHRKVQAKALNGSVSPLQAMKYLQVAASVEAAIDCCELVARTVEKIVFKEA